MRVPDPIATSRNGLVRYDEGRELAVSREWSGQLSLIASARLLDARQLDETGAATYDKTSENMPKHTAACSANVVCKGDLHQIPATLAR